MSHGSAEALTPATRERVLVTGAAGYVGAHLLVALANAGYECVPLDNFCSGKPRAVELARTLAPDGAIADMVEADIRDRQAVAALLASRRIDGVIHLAGLKSVGDSMASPLRYYDNNVTGSIVLLEELERANIRRFVFSSSATVYSPDAPLPFLETSPVGPVSPYGRTKLMIEQLLADLAASDPRWRIARLRYFNPVGAHPSGRIGEDPRGTPNNLMPYLCDAAAGRAKTLRIFGDDYPTSDGTGVRDYIHVMDLAEGHVAALRALTGNNHGNCLTFNLGTGRGTTVSALIDTFERVNSVRVQREVTGRRPGDVAVSYSDCSKARALMGWAASRSLQEMCRDAWAWKSRNPEGY